LIAFRDYHNTTHENPAINPALEIRPDYVKVTPYQGVPDLYLHHDGAEVRAAGDWYRNFEYDRERERGLDDKEDLFHPFDLVFANATCTVVASTSATPSSLAAPPGGGSSGRDEAIASSGRRAAAQFIVRRGDQHTVIAGYHWFSDWGRDTMIALPGLTLATGRPDVARSILREFAKHVDRGMLPNRFPDAGEAPEYNTADATLWFFEAVRALNDAEFARELYPVMADIIDWHERGTRYGIKVDEDGMLQTGEPGVQLTWMDAKVGDWVVTPRHGKPVEIQALWYNALRIMQDVAPNQRRFRDLADRARWSFLPTFWNDSGGYLYDVVNGDQRDAAIRPNQIFAISLHHTMVPPQQANSILKTVEQHLLTPYGLRSLAPGDPQYRGRYEGDPWSRDSAYHQGTVWPWLIGPFISALLAVNHHSEQARKQAGQWLAPLKAYMEDRGVGQLPEIFDGDPPHRPCGCIAQAWSVAELLRVEAEIAAGTPQATALRA
jgi:glycogen debranching enzyme